MKLVIGLKKEIIKLKRKAIIQIKRKARALLSTGYSPYL